MFTRKSLTYSLLLLLLVGCGGGSTTSGSSSQPTSIETGSSNTPFTSELTRGYSKLVRHAEDSLLTKITKIDAGQMTFDGLSATEIALFEDGAIVLFSDRNFVILGMEMIGANSVQIKYRDAEITEVYQQLSLSMEGSLSGTSATAPATLSFSEPRKLSNKMQMPLAAQKSVEALPACMKMIELKTSSDSEIEIQVKCEIDTNQPTLSYKPLVGGAIAGTERKSGIIAIEGRIVVSNVNVKKTKLSIIDKEADGCLADKWWNTGCFVWGGDHFTTGATAKVITEVDFKGTFADGKGEILIPGPSYAVSIPNSGGKFAGVMVWFSLTATGELSIQLSGRITQNIDVSMVDSKVSNNGSDSFNVNAKGSVVGEILPVGARLSVGADLGHGFKITPLLVKAGVGFGGEGSLSGGYDSLIGVATIDACGRIFGVAKIRAEYEVLRKEGRYFEFRREFYKSSEVPKCINLYGNTPLAVIVDPEFQEIDTSEVHILTSKSKSRDQMESYSWTQKSGPKVTMSFADTSAPMIKVGSLKPGDEVVFEVVAIDKYGQVATATALRRVKTNTALKDATPSSKKPPVISDVFPKTVILGQSTRFSFTGANLSGRIASELIGGTCNPTSAVYASSKFSVDCTITSTLSDHTEIKANSLDFGLLAGFVIEIKQPIQSVSSIAPKAGLVNVPLVFEGIGANLTSFTALLNLGICQNEIVKSSTTFSFTCTPKSAGSGTLRLLNNVTGAVVYESAFIATLPVGVIAPPLAVRPVVPSSPTPGSGSDAGPTMSGTSVVLGWGAVAGATYYDVGLRDLTTTALKGFTPSLSSMSATGLIGGRAYKWNVAACNSAGCSAYTSPIQFTMAGGATAPVGAALALTGFDKTSVVAQNGAQPLTLYGSGFTASSQVRWRNGGASGTLAATYVSPTQLNISFNTTLSGTGLWYFAVANGTQVSAEQSIVSQ